MPNNTLAHILTTSASIGSYPLNNYDINYRGKLGQGPNGAPPAPGGTLLDIDQFSSLNNNFIDFYIGHMLQLNGEDTKEVVAIGSLEHGEELTEEIADVAEIPAETFDNETSINTVEVASFSAGNKEQAPSLAVASSDVFEVSTGGTTKAPSLGKKIIGGIKSIFGGGDMEEGEPGGGGMIMMSSGAPGFGELSIAELNPIRYRGYYFDAETGYYFCQTRYYSPEWKRFISADMFFIAGDDVLNGSNMYAYCNGNPVMFSDPSGMGIWSWFKKGASFTYNKVLRPVGRFAFGVVVTTAVLTVVAVRTLVPIAIELLYAIQPILEGAGQGFFPFLAGLSGLLGTGSDGWHE